MKNLPNRLSTFRRTLYEELDPLARPEIGMSWLNKFTSFLVVVCVISVILETEPLLVEEYSMVFNTLNMVFLYAFTVEYITRIWVMTESHSYDGPFGRLRYAITLPALVDLLTVLPFWFGAGSEILLMRILRLLRILKLAKIPQVSEAIQNLSKALSARKIELILSVVLAFLLMVIAATTLYLLERDMQPETFGSIPRALWWGMATLTTVGYGDVYPITTMGKIAAGLYAFSGIGLVAMPTGIFAAAMSDIVQKSPTRKLDEEVE